MYLRADTADGLVRLQLKVNQLLMGRADYTNIQFADGFWYAWFLVDVDQNPEVLKINGAISGSNRQRT